MMQTHAHSAETTPRRRCVERCLRRFHLAEFAFRLREFFCQFLLVDTIRTAVTAVRYFYFVVIRRRLRTWDPQAKVLVPTAVSHNQEVLKSVRGFAVVRSNFLLYPLSAIRMRKSDPVLSIGPRSEGEILNLMGLGFHNIRAIDLISYSPWVDLGDMHAMPYTDNQFAAVIMGWCLFYSTNQRQAALEAVRVTKNGGLIAVGISSLTTERGQKTPDGTPIKMMQTLTDLLAHFQPHVDRLYFSHDLPHGWELPITSPVPPKNWNLMAIFSVKK